MDSAEEYDTEKLRSELEQELHTWSHPQQATPEEVCCAIKFIQIINIVAVPSCGGIELDIGNFTLTVIFTNISAVT